MTFSSNQSELRRVAVCCLFTCIYLPGLITVISYEGLLHSVTNGSSFYLLGLIFLGELLKALYLGSYSEFARNYAFVYNGIFDEEYNYSIRVTFRRHTNTRQSRVLNVLKAFVFLFCVLFTLFTGIMLFGTPVFEWHEETMMLSSLLTLLTVYPLTAYSGMKRSMQLFFGVRSYSENTAVQMLVNNALLTMCGAWMGAAFVPLDWETPWQLWTVPCYLGAIGGFVLSNALTLLKLILMSAAHKYPALNSIVNVLNVVRLSK